MAVAQDTALQTLSMLEERLQRINFFVSGEGESALKAGTAEPSGTAVARLRTLERNLNTLAARSFVVSDVLLFERQHPELFHSTDASSFPDTLSPAGLVQLLLAHEELYNNSAAQLSTFNEVKDIPDSAPMSKLLSMQERTQKLQAKQSEQARELADLRIRSATVVERWYEDGVLDMGERWAEWEARLKDCEILVRRKEAAKKREEGMV